MSVSSSLLFSPWLLRASLLALLAILLLAGCAEESAPIKTEPTPVVVMPQLLTLEAQAVSHQLHSLGRLVSAEKLPIGVEVAGTVAKVYFREGQRVKTGETLLTLDNTKQLLRLKRAQANVAGATAELNQARQSYQRFHSLGDRGAVSRDELDKMAMSFASAEARLAQSQAEQKLAQQELQELVVTSPVDGVIEAENIEPGQRVRPGDSLGILQARGSLQVVTFVTEAEVNQVAAGTAATLWVAATGAQAHQARVETIALTATPDTGNFEIKLRVINAERLLREGMSASVELPLAAQPRLLIPREALVDRHRKRLVYVLEQGVVRAREPRLGLALDGGWEVLGGLQAGEQLLVSQLENLFDGLELANPVDKSAIVLSAASTRSVGE